MTTPVFCSSTGSNTSPYETWAKAATSFATALAQASTSGDVIVVDATNPPTDNTAWTFAANVSVIASTNSGTATITPTIMGASTFLGSSSTTAATLAGAFKVYFYGITIRSGGTTNTVLNLCNSSTTHYEFEDCYFWSGTTGSSATISIGIATAGARSYVLLKRCTVRFSAAGQTLQLRGHVEMIGGSISSSGTAPNTLFGGSNNTMHVRCTGVNLSHVTGTLVGSQTGSSAAFDFVQCRLGSGVTPMAVQVTTNKGSARVSVFDCASGDTHGLFGYYDALGSIESDTGTKLTAGASGQGWKITTTSAVSFSTPFVTPWISLYSAAASAATYKMELLRNNGTATTYNDAEVWGEFSAKDNSGFTNSDVFTDRQALVDWAAGTAGSTSGRTGTGTGNWTIGSSNSPASFIVDSGTTITQAEDGHIRARVAVGLASVSNLFLDPQIRT